MEGAARANFRGCPAAAALLLRVATTLLCKAYRCKVKTRAYKGILAAAAECQPQQSWQGTPGVLPPQTQVFEQKDVEMPFQSVVGLP
jgi:hypothetical protein